MTFLTRRPRTKDDLPALVNTLLAESGDGYPTLARMASRMCMSPRTLKRRLRAHGVRFRQLLDGARFRESARLLEDSELTVEQIALRLGYSSPANFSRAFRRWAGHPPGAYRLGMMGEPASGEPQRWARAAGMPLAPMQRDTA
ncbi:helix-turn-helix transcriptional regulator [Solimonas sp. K1W22B-7]|uniref:helix-turn-helix transcriptional regulator n=1 Tax=Solimonas sp. K1W22B-7 TaxID=2303331 RepID=UPI0013C41370|nr:helix-turn-helix transcriptional regulator [Solimonas sp. K1W22B-7]